MKPYFVYEITYWLGTIRTSVFIKADTEKDAVSIFKARKGNVVIDSIRRKYV